jgi:phage terminase large subunit
MTTKPSTADVIDLGYVPRAPFVAFHRRRQRFAAIVAHRRCGKTVACIMDLIDRALSLKVPKGAPPGRFAYVGPLLGQAKEVAWPYLTRFAGPVLARPPNESELWVEVIGGARIRIHGSDNPDRLRGVYLDGVILDEFADMAPSVWGSVVRPMLADRQGFAVFIGTPKGRNGFWQIVETAGQFPDRWFRAILPASATGILNELELEDARRDMTTAQFDQEFECSFDAAIMGSYYGELIAEAERQGRITTVNYDPALPVHCAWDLGIGDATSIWFAQFAGAEIRLIDFYENNSQALSHYAEVLASKPYKYGNDFVPHDAKVRELGTGKTRVETLAELGRRPSLVPNATIDDGINAARLVLPRCWFDRSKCAVGLEALRQYRTDYDERKRAFSDKPRHDWTSNGSDAFRYLSMAWRQVATTMAEPRKPLFRALNEMTYDQLWELEEGTPDRPQRYERL